MAPPGWHRSGGTARVAADAHGAPGVGRREGWGVGRETCMAEQGRVRVGDRAERHLRGETSTQDPQPRHENEGQEENADEQKGKSLPAPASPKVLCLMGDKWLSHAFPAPIIQVTTSLTALPPPAPQAPRVPLPGCVPRASSGPCPAPSDPPCVTLQRGWVAAPKKPQTVPRGRSLGQEPTGRQDPKSFVLSLPPKTAVAIKNGEIRGLSRLSPVTGQRCSPPHPDFR